VIRQDLLDGLRTDMKRVQLVVREVGVLDRIENTRWKLAQHEEPLCRLSAVDVAVGAFEISYKLLDDVLLELRVAAQECVEGALELRDQSVVASQALIATIYSRRDENPCCKGRATE
jgi:hypothetical protein